ncbi:non-ribosomal peptide synthetase [Chitinophaga sp. GbtcB8]|uniref:non-ribosomal peptide synthetase n=1 Tax=Chitinophaga sp. GbtcB8 TaxID=2824753 RepID=UPI001C2F7220|nr:non-ribosomal peptide synthetase [Chitinophaga sp. GbtcB8]
MSKETYVFPMSAAQRSLWLFEKANYTMEASPYNTVIALRLKGDLDVQVLKESIGLIFSRHEALRTTFRRENDHYYQVVHADTVVAFEERSCPEENVEEFLQERSAEPFDLENGPLSKFFLLQTDRKTFTLIVTVHHIVFDGWSVGIFVKELSLFYNSLSDSRQPMPVKLDIQYADYTVWKEKHQREQLNSGMEYWKQYLEGARPYVEFPFDRAREKRNSFRGRSERFTFDKTIIAEVKHFCDKNAVTHFALFCAVYSTLLYRYTGQEDLTIPVPLANREDRKELEQLIGVFVNMLPVRVHVNKDLPFLELVKQIQNNMAAVLDHQNMDIYTLQEQLNFKQETINASLFNFAFSHINVEFGDLQLNEVEVEYLHFNRNATRRDLTFFIYENRHTFFGEIEYSTDLLLPDTIRRFIGNYTTLLSDVLKGGERLVKDLTFLDLSEQRLLLEDFNRTGTNYPRESAIIELFELQVKKSADRQALYYEGRSFSYLELNRMADNQAALLSGPGIVLGDIIPVMATNPLRMIVGILAVLKMGKAYMPVDPVIPAERAALMIAESASPVILTEGTIKLPENFSITGIEIVTDLSDSGKMPDKKWKGGPDSLCYVMYTSGSTGKPKGIRVLNKNVARLVLNQEYLAITPDDRILQTAPATFDASTLEIWGALLNGAALYLTRKESILTASSLHGQLQRFRITTLWLTAPLFGEMATIDPAMFSTLRNLIVGGDVIPVGPMNAVRAACPQPVIINGYGPTENTTFSTAYKIEKEFAGPIPIGKPISNSRAYILDDDLQLLPLGAVGTLFVGGDGLSEGYLTDVDLTARQFIANPFISGERIYNTGDLTRWHADGNIEFIGRKDKQVKINGFRIEPKEIENTLNEYPGIRNVHVKAAQQRLFAYFVTDGDAIQTDDLKAYLKQRLLPSMIPDQFIQLDSLPLTANGKIDEEALPVPGPQRSGKVASNADSTEKILARMWEKALGAEPDSIGPDDFFFEIGGHSILAVQLVTAIEKEFDVDIDVGDFFENDTISFLVALINKRKEDSPAVVIDRLPEQPYYEVSSGQTRLWVLDQLQEGKGVYNINWSLKITGALDLVALKDAAARMIERHEILRTKFVYVNNQIYQQIEPTVDPDLVIVLQDWNELKSKYTTIENYINHATEAVFDLTQTPLFRICILRLSDQEHILVSSFHHIIADEWSNKVFIREFSRLYNAALNKTPLILEPLPVQYRDYAAWHNARFSGKDTDSEKYWLQKLAGALPKNEFAYKKGGRPAAKTYSSAVISVDLDPKTAALLQQIAGKENATLFMVLLAGLNLLVGKYTGENDILTGVPVSGRDHAAFEHQLGFYVNTVVMRNRIDYRRHFNQFLADVKDNAIEAFKHADYPFDRLVENIGIKNDLSRAPVFELMLGLLDMEDELPDPLTSLEGIQIESYSVDQKKSPFDLIFNARKKRDRINIELIYNVNLFDEWFATQLLQDYTGLMDQVAENSAIPVQDIVFSSPAGIAAAEQRTEQNATIIDCFEAQVKAHPEKTAIVSAIGMISYRELSDVSNNLCRELMDRHGIKKGDCVGVMFTRVDLAIAAILGILRAGASYLPLNTAESEKRLGHMLTEAEVKIVLADEPATSERIGMAGTVVIVSNLDSRKKASPSINNATAADAAYIIYTSGSTGIPKGVQVGHSQVVNLVKSTNYQDIRPENNVMQFSPLFFDGSVFEIFGALLNGATLKVIEKDKALNVQDLSAFIEAQKIDIAFLTTAFFNSMVEIRPRLISQFDKIYFGGEMASVNIVRTAIRYRKNEDAIVHVYGPTETTVFATYYPVKEITDDMVNVPVGLPVSGASVFILDNNLKPVPKGVIGEIFIGGAGVSRGYLGNPGLNGEKFVKDVLTKGDVLYRTGDLAKWNHHGVIEFIGRNDSQVKIRGHRIELNEIEAAILTQSAVFETRVLALRENGNAQKLIAYWTGHSTYTSEDVLAYLIKALPAYMIPASVRKIAAFPLNGNGKIDNEALLSITGFETDQKVIPLTSDAEAQLAAIWAHFLDTDKLSADSNFFEIGGHSLTAMKVAAAIYDHTGVNIPLKDMYIYPTIREMNNYINSAKWMKVHAQEGSFSQNDNMLV